MSHKPSTAATAAAPADFHALMLQGSEQPRTTSRLIAEKFGKRHANVLRTIADLLPDLDEAAQLNFEFSEYTDPTGRSLPEYILTKDAFLLLAMNFTGKAAQAWKVQFINAFNACAKDLEATRRALEHSEARHAELTSYHAMREALVDARASAGKDSPKAHHFMNEARLMGYAMTGVSAGLDKDSLSTEQLHTLASLEAANARFLRDGMAFSERKERLRDFVTFTGSGQRPSITTGNRLAA